MIKKDIEYMELALTEARKAMFENEVPVGCIVVDEQGEILSLAHNKVESSKDATCHAEVLAIKKAAQLLGDWRLVNATLYTTVEPCLMCAGAVILSRLKRVVYGCKDPRHGAAGSLVNLFELDHPIHKVKIEGGVLEEKAIALLKQFFQQRRREKCSQSMKEKVYLKS